MKNQIKETFRITTTRPVAILMIVVAVFVFGIISYQRLTLNLMPDISYPSLTVRTEYPGTAPEEIETIISRPIEQALGVVSNLANISSISKAGFSDVILEFTWDTDMNFATQDVREKLDQVFLPMEVKRPMILRYDPTLDPIIRMGMYGEIDLFTLRRIAEEDVRRELETLPGIAAVKVKGGLEEEIRVEISEEQLTILNINIEDVNTRLFQENINLAGGNLKEGDTEYLVRTLNEFKTLEEISNIIIGNRSSAEIRIRDIGRVFKTNKEREVITRVNAYESVDIEIFKEADANIVTVAEMIKQRVYGSPQQQDFVRRLNDGTLENTTASQRQEMTGFLSHGLPEGVDILTLADQSIFIKSSLDEVMNTAVLGGILAIIVLFFFLRKVMSTMIVGLAIPVSVIATFAPMYLFNVSLNIMSLGGLALGIGMLVDNSIVVLESIFRCREEGDSIIEAAVRGTGEVGSAVIASTLTTIAVFFPIVFVEGIAGQIFGDMSLVVVFSLIASLLVALFFIPMLASRKLDKGKSTIAGSITSVDAAKYDSINMLKRKMEYAKESKTARAYSSVYIWAVVSIFWTLALIVFKIFIFTGTALLILLIGVGNILKATYIHKLAVYTPFSIFPKLLNRAKSTIPEGYFDKTIWPNLMHFDVFDNFDSLFTRYFKHLREKSLFRRVVKIILTFEFVLIYALLRIILHTQFSIFGKFFQVLIVLFNSIGIGFLSIAGTALLMIGLPLLGLFNITFEKISKAYPRILKTSLNNKSAVLVVSALILFVSISQLLPQLGSELIPEMHQGEFYVDFAYPVGTPLEQTEALIEPVEETIKGTPGVMKISTVIGVEKNSTNSKSEQGEHTARILVTLEETDNLIAQEERVMQEIRDRTALLSGVTTELSRPTLFSFKTPVEVEVRGFDLATLKRISTDIESRMSEVSGLTDVRSNIQRGSPEIQIKYDRLKLAKSGLNIYSVASLVKNKVQGSVATEFKDQERRIDILVRVREQDKANLQDLYNLVINPGAPVPIPLSAVSDIKINEGPSEIRRINQQRVALITANIAGADLGTISQRIELAIKDVPRPDDFYFEITGQNKEMEVSSRSLQFALILAVFLIYVVMASQFESLVHPFVIMFTIPLAIIGVIVTLYALAIPVSIVVFIGMIMLAGIVVNNAIVLVDYINQLRKRGMSKVDAIIHAGEVRLRPILMTTLTTVLGLLPMALGVGEGAEIRTPMAITVIAGLLSSTVLTLVVIPTVYAVIDRKN